MNYEETKIRIYRYSINWGETGGIVIATDEYDAKRKIKFYHETMCKFDFNFDEDELSIWEWQDDDYYNIICPYVINCC